MELNLLHPFSLFSASFISQRRVGRPTGASIKVFGGVSCASQQLVGGTHTRRARRERLELRIRELKFDELNQCSRLLVLSQRYSEYLY